MGTSCRTRMVGHLSSLQNPFLGKNCRLTGRDWQRSSVRFEALELVSRKVRKNEVVGEHRKGYDSFLSAEYRLG